MSEEIWRPIPGYEDLYMASRHGRIWSHPRVVEYEPGHMARRRGKLLKRVRVGPRRYPTVQLSKNRHKQPWKVDRLVALSFLGENPTNADVLHHDDDPENNHVSNLRYGNDADNARDRRRNGNDHNANKVRCIHGHDYTPENTYIVKATGHRSCLSCRRDAERRRNRRSAVLEASGGA